MIDTLRSSDYRPVVGRTCTMVTEGGLSIPVTVEEVVENPRAMPSRSRPGRRVPFTVFLKGPLDPATGDAHCRLLADGLPDVALLVIRIVPQDEDNDSVWYQIVIN